jgi:predicted ester cyclase
MTTNIQPNHQESVHRQVVRSYFHKVLDQGNVELIEDLFHPQCVMHRPGGTVVGLDAVRGVVEHRNETFSQFGTEIHDIFGSGDRWVARLTHRGVGGGIWRSRLGSYDISGKTVTWNAIAIFRFEENRIIEEWVTRDELGIILQLGLFPTV